MIELRVPLTKQETIALGVDVPHFFIEWEGKRLADCDREELMECVRFLVWEREKLLARFPTKIEDMQVTVFDKDGEPLLTRAICDDLDG